MSAAGRSRGLVLNVLVVVVTVAVLVPVAELIVRVVRPQGLPSQEFIRGFVLPGMYVTDERAGYRLAQNFSGHIERLAVVTDFTTNSLGMRGPEPGEKRGMRVLALGDSYTFGWGVPQGEEWIHAAGEELNRALGADAVETWNGGVNGYGTEGALATLERVGPALRPDIVLLGFFANDFTDNFLGTGIYTVRNGLLFDQFSHDHLQESVLARESHLYRMVMAAWETIRVERLGGAPTAHPVRQFSRAEFERGRETSEGLILRMRDACARMGARFAVVWLPADVYALNGSRPEDIPLRWKLQKRIDAAGIPGIDLLPVATSEPRVGGLYIPNDGHLTVRGNRVLGRAVASWLLDEGWFAEESPGGS